MCLGVDPTETELIVQETIPKPLVKEAPLDLLQHIKDLVGSRPCRCRVILVSFALQEKDRVFP